MKKFDRYMFKNLAIATFFITIVLAAVVMLTQSLRFLELVIESGASSFSFWILTMLALPRFLEIIVPLAIMAAVLFVYNRMTIDSELVVIRSTGYSPLNIAKSALYLALLATLLLYIVSFFLAPFTLSNMHKMRQEIKAQFSTVLFREGVFNQVGKGLTVYVRKRASNNEMHGLLIHDTRKENEVPSTIIAKRGALIMDENGSQVIVYEGARHEYNKDKRILQKLNFERYTIDLPDSGPVRKRWKEPDERNLMELLNPDKNDERDRESIRDFVVEINKRITNPILALTFTLLSCAFLLIGPVNRRGQSRRIVMAILSIVMIQGLYLASYNIARHNNIGFILMYGLTLLPALGSLFFLCPLSENIRRKFLYNIRRGTQTLSGNAKGSA